MARSIIGARIRERRSALGITQSDLARRIGISPSYLNLIERNKRGIAGRLLNRVAGELELRVEDLDGAAERRLFDQLEEIAADPRFGALGMETDRLGELIGRFPGWARGLGTLARSERELAARVRALSDRLTHDPVLAEAVHRMLTHTAALRSAAEIVTEVPDLEPERRRRFEQILADESRRLSDAGQGLAAYFDKANTTAHAVTPTDEIDALLERRANRFEEVEAAVAAGDAGEAVPEPELAAEAACRAGDAIDALLETAAEIETEAARDRARGILMRYAADALALPEAHLAALAEDCRYDMELIAGRSGQPIDRVCRRLASLAPAPGRPRFGYVATNAAGSVLDCLPIPGLVPARHGEACPLWISFRAGASPGQTLRQRAVFPTGLGFVFVARARTVGPAGFGQAALHVADLLAMDERDATLTVYGGSGRGEIPPEPVGTSCRICPREDCAHRIDAGFGTA